MSIETKLFELINEMQYTAALTLLDHADINALDEDGCSLLMAAIENHIGSSVERYVFIERILSNPKFHHANKPIYGTISTPFQSVIDQSDVRTVDLLIKYKDIQNIQVILHKEKLFYEYHAQTIKRRKEYIENNPTSALRDTIGDDEKTLASLLLVTIHHAINTDDPSLLKRLADAGAKLHLPLKDGTRPIDLLHNKEHLNIHKWLYDHISEYIRANPVYLLAGQNVTRKYEESAQTIVERHAIETQDKIRGMFKFYDYKPGAKPSSVEPEPKGGNTPK